LPLPVFKASLSRRAPRSALIMRGLCHPIRSRLVPARGGGGLSGCRGHRRSQYSALTATRNVPSVYEPTQSSSTSTIARRRSNPLPGAPLATVRITFSHSTGGIRGLRQPPAPAPGPRAAAAGATRRSNDLARRPHADPVPSGPRRPDERLRRGHLTQTKRCNGRLMAVLPT